MFTVNDPTVYPTHALILQTHHALQRPCCGQELLRWRLAVNAWSSSFCPEKSASRWTSAALFAEPMFGVPPPQTELDLQLEGRDAALKNAELHKRDADAAPPFDRLFSRNPPNPCLKISLFGPLVKKTEEPEEPPHQQEL